MIDVVLVCFNSDEALLGRAVDSVAVAASRVGIDADILLFDNGSVVPVRERIGMRVVRSSSNLGFGRAVNAAMSYCASEHVLLLNPDAELGEDALVGFLSAAGKHRDALLSGWLCKNGQVQVDAFLMWRFSTSRWFRRMRYLRYLHSNTSSVVVSVDKVSGGALFARRELLSSFGPFDDRFFLYGEDADLSLRAKERDVPLLAVPAALVNHVGAASQKDYSVLVERARADAAIRLGAYHSPIWLSYLQRIELSAITVVGALFGGSTSVSRRSRLARLREVLRWGLSKDLPRYNPN